MAVITTSITIERFLFGFLLQRRRWNHAGEAKAVPFVPGFQPYHRIIRNLGATGIGSMIRMRSDGLQNKDLN